jgi:hypothetical protein
MKACCLPSATLSSKVRDARIVIVEITIMVLSAITTFEIVVMLGCYHTPRSYFGNVIERMVP